MNACGKGGSALFRKTAGTIGFHEPCSSPQFVSHLVRKIVKKQRTQSCACSPSGCGLPPARSPASALGSGSQRPRNSVVAAEACSRSRHPVEVWAFELRLLLRCQLPAGTPTLLHNSRSKKCLLKQCKRDTAARVSDFAVWVDLIVTPAS